MEAIQNSFVATFLELTDSAMGNFHCESQCKFACLAVNINHAEQDSPPLRRRRFQCLRESASDSFSKVAKASSHSMH